MDDQHPVQFLGLTPYLYYEDAAAALDWLSRVLGFSEEVRYLDAGGQVAEAEMEAGGCRIMIGGGRSAGPDEGRGQTLIVHVADVDAHHADASRAGVAVEPPEDKPYGARTCTVTDPGGYRWTLWESRGEVQLADGWQEVRPAGADGPANSA